MQAVQMMYHDWEGLGGGIMTVGMGISLQKAFDALLGRTHSSPFPNRISVPTKGMPPYPERDDLVNQPPPIIMPGVNRGVYTAPPPIIMNADGEAGSESKPPLGVEAVPDLTGKSREEAEKILGDAGFVTKKNPIRGKYQDWRHPDGSIIWIGPDLAIDRLGPKVWADDHSQKYHPRYGPDGRRRGTDEPHDTGEILNGQK